MDDRSLWGDYFDRARLVASALLLAAGAVALIGSFMHWVTITPAGEIGGTFEDNAGDVKNVSEPFMGIEAAEGWLVVTGGAVMALGALLLLLRRKRLYAWLTFLAAVVTGSIAISSYRAIEDPTSGLSRRMELVGDADPALGLLLVAAAGVVGLLAAVTGLVATPRDDTEE